MEFLKKFFWCSLCLFFLFSRSSYVLMCLCKIGSISFLGGSVESEKVRLFQEVLNDHDLSPPFFLFISLKYFFNFFSPTFSFFNAIEASLQEKAVKLLELAKDMFGQHNYSWFTDLTRFRAYFGRDTRFFGTWPNTFRVLFLFGTSACSFTNNWHCRYRGSLFLVWIQI